MKKILVSLIVSAFFCGSVLATIKVIEVKRDEDIVVQSFCVSGLKIVTADSGSKQGGMAMIQLYEERKGKVVPVKCRK